MMDIVNMTMLKVYGTVRKLAQSLTHSLTQAVAQTPDAGVQKSARENATTPKRQTALQSDPSRPFHHVPNGLDAGLCPSIARLARSKGKAKKNARSGAGW
jgi:hypothetical protein